MYYSFVFSADYVWSDEWATYKGNEYKYFADPAVTATGARHKCAEHGGLLVSINSPEEEEFLMEKVIQKRTLSAFMGGSDEVTGKNTSMSILL